MAYIKSSHDHLAINKAHLDAPEQNKGPAKKKEGFVKFERLLNLIFCKI